MIIYLHKKCSTCKAALNFLEKKNIPLNVKDIVIEAPTIEELQMMLNFQNGNIKKIMNTSGLLYKEMGLAVKLDNMSRDDILALLSHHGMLVKRPFLLGTNFGLTGFKEAEWSHRFSNESHR